MELLVFFLGVIAAIIGYIFSNFFIRPISEYHGIRAKIGYKLTYYSHIITSPGSSGQLAEEAYPVIRDIACDLERRYLSVPVRHFVAWLRIIPSEEAIIDAKGRIIRISNSLGRSGRTDENHVDLGEIFKSLKIKELKGGMTVESGKIYGKHREEQ